MVEVFSWLLIIVIQTMVITLLYSPAFVSLAAMRVVPLQFDAIFYSLAAIVVLTPYESINALICNPGFYEWA